MALALSAQRLLDGEVVYLTAEGGWSDALPAARLVETKPEGAALEALAGPFVTARQIVNPHLIEVSRGEGRIVGKTARELIRANGPTVRLDLGKQARVAGHS